jgi:hypothetical protein
MATTFAKSLAKRTTVEGNILLAVLPGTLYKITGIGDASATFKMLIDSFLRRFIIIWRNRKYRRKC